MTPSQANSAAAAIRIGRIYMASTAVAFALVASYVLYQFGVLAHRMTLAVVTVVVVGIFDLIAMGAWYHVAKARAKRQDLAAASRD